MSKHKRPPIAAGPRWRWRIAAALNRLPGTCWAHLVSWALRSGDLTIRGTFDVKPCRAGDPDFDNNGACYCGKNRTAELQARLDSASAKTETTSWRRPSATTPQPVYVRPGRQ